MENKITGVYIVRQTQPAEYYQDKTIAIFSNREQAEKLSRALNKEYGYGVRFDKKDKYALVGLCSVCKTRLEKRKQKDNNGNTL